MIELDVERIAAGGEGVAREECGRVVFVHGALPGERVAARLIEEKKTFARAELIDVLTPAPARVEPPCPYVAAGCGGCGWQHVEPAEQVRLKQAIMVDALERIGKLTDSTVDLAPPLPTTGFRTTVRVAVRDGRPGFHRARSHDVVNVEHCMVTHPLLDEIIATARFPKADEAVLRCSVASQERIAWPRPSAQGTSVPKGVRVGRRAVVHEDVAGRTYRIGAASFFQTRPDGAEALVQQVRAAAGELADSKGPLVDAYCGVGLFAGALGANRPITAIEHSPSSVADATHNLRDLDAIVVPSDMERWKPRRGVTAELIVADPPREGLKADVVATLSRLDAERIVLVSCDPASLARDTHLLGGNGYVHVRSVLVDLFPHTPHVEVVTQFDRK